MSSMESVARSVDHDLARRRKRLFEGAAKRAAEACSMSELQDAIVCVLCTQAVVEEAARALGLGAVEVREAMLIFAARFTSESGVRVAWLLRSGR